MSTNLHHRWLHPRFVLRLQRWGVALAWCGLLAPGAVQAQPKIAEAYVGMHSSLGVVEVHDVQPGASAQASYIYDDGGTRAQLQAQATRQALRLFVTGQDSRMDSRFSASAGARSDITLVDEVGRALDPAVVVVLSLKAGASEVLMESVTEYSGELSFSALVDGGSGPTGVVGRWRRLVGPGGTAVSNCLGTPDLCVEGSWPVPAPLDFTLQPTLTDNRFTLDLRAQVSGSHHEPFGEGLTLNILSAAATWGLAPGRALPEAAPRMPERIGLRFDETGEILWANAAPVPEPGSWALLAAGLAGLAAWLRRRRAAVMAGALLLGPVSAWAQGIEAIATIDRSSPDQLITEASRVREFRADGGVVAWPTWNGNVLSFTHRMAWMSGQRVRPPEPFGLLLWSNNVDYSIGFLVEDPDARGYMLSFDTVLRGYLTAEWNGASPDLGGAVAMLEPLRAGISTNGYDQALGALDTPSRELRATMADAFGNRLINDSDHFELAAAFTGTRYFTLSFIAPGLPNTTASAIQISNGEALLRFGLDPTSADFRNANYPGVDGEPAADHGHFVTVNVLFNAAPVPEPATGAMLLAGLLSVTVLAWRRRPG